jgi:TRAP-type uncharacterized transport system substrate-binding protein
MSSSKEDVPSIGVYCTLVTAARVPEETVYEVTRALFERLEDFKKQHPALGALTREWMVRPTTAPRHSGAARYFKEAKLE